MAKLSGLGSLDSAEAGALRESVANDYFTRNGFTPLDGKCGSNCFDGVYVKGDQVVINEVKPLNTNNSIKLSQKNPDTTLDPQMTIDWVESRAAVLNNSGDPAKMATAQTILKAIGDGNLVRLVSGVNGNGMTIVKLVGQ